MSEQTFPSGNVPKYTKAALALKGRFERCAEMSALPAGAKKPVSSKDFNVLLLDAICSHFTKTFSKVLKQGCGLSYENGEVTPYLKTMTDRKNLLSLQILLRGQDLTPEQMEDAGKKFSDFADNLAAAAKNAEVDFTLVDGTPVIKGDISALLQIVTTFANKLGVSDALADINAIEHIQSRREDVHNVTGILGRLYALNPEYRGPVLPAHKLN